MIKINYYFTKNIKQLKEEINYEKMRIIYQKLEIN
jgi:hypothetical protein